MANPPVNALIRVINWAGDTAEVPLKALESATTHLPRVIAPMVLGGIGGWLTGVSWQMGALQGAVVQTGCRNPLEK